MGGSELDDIKAFGVVDLGGKGCRALHPRRGLAQQLCATGIVEDISSKHQADRAIPDKYLAVSSGLCQPARIRALVGWQIIDLS